MLNNVHTEEDDVLNDAPFCEHDGTGGKWTVQDADESRATIKCPGCDHIEGVATFFWTQRTCGQCDVVFERKEWLYLEGYEEVSE